MLLWTSVYRFLCGQMFLLGVYLVVGLLTCVVSATFIFWGNCRAVFPSGGASWESGFLFLRLLACACHYLLFRSGCCGQGVSHCGFHLLSLVADHLEHLFMRLLAICVSLGKCLFESLAHRLIVLFVCS